MSVLRPQSCSDPGREEGEEGGLGRKSLGQSAVLRTFGQSPLSLRNRPILASLRAPSWLGGSVALAQSWWCTQRVASEAVGQLCSPQRGRVKETRAVPSCGCHQARVPVAPPPIVFRGEKQSVSRQRWL